MNNTDDLLKEFEAAVQYYEQEVESNYPFEKDWSHEILIVANARDDIDDLLKHLSDPVPKNMIKRIDNADIKWKQWAKEYQYSLIEKGQQPYEWTMRLENKPKSQWWWWIDQIRS